MDQNDDVKDKLSNYFARENGSADETRDKAADNASAPEVHDMPVNAQQPDEALSHRPAMPPEDTVSPAPVLQNTDKEPVSGEVPSTSVKQDTSGEAVIASVQETPGVHESLNIKPPLIKSAQSFIADLHQFITNVGTFVGLDIGVHAVKLVQLAITPQGITLIKCAHEEIPHRGTVTPEERRALLLESIRCLVHDERLEAVSVATCVGGSSVGVASLILPKMPKKDLSGALAFEFKKALPFDLSTAIFDYQIVREFTDGDSEKIEVIAMAAQRSVIDEHIELLSEAGLRPAKIDIIPNALGTLLAHLGDDEKKGIVALADLGATSTTICFFNDGRLEFSREVLTGADHITQAMARTITTEKGSIAITFKEAEAFKKRWGIPTQDDIVSPAERDAVLSPSQISALIRPVLERLMTEIKRSLNYYRQTFKISKIDRVFLTGGGSRLRNIDQFFRKNLPGMEICFFNPLHYITGWSDDRFGQHEMLEEYAPQLAVAAGLALDKKGKTNFIPLRERVQQKLKLVEFALKIAVPFIIVTILGFHVLLSGQSRRYWKLVLDARSQLAFVEPTMKKVREFEQLQAMVATREKLLIQAVGRRPVWSGILKELTHVIPEGVILSRLSIDEDLMPMEMVLEGDIYQTYTSIDLALSHFLITLDESPFFSRVVLLSSTKDPYSPTPKGSFQVRCQIVY